MGWFIFISGLNHISGRYTLPTVSRTFSITERSLFFVISLRFRHKCFPESHCFKYGNRKQAEGPKSGDEEICQVNKRHSGHWIGDTILSCLRREQTLQPTCRYFWAFYFKRNWNHWPCLNKFGAIWFVDHWTTNRGLRPLLLVQCSPVGVPKYVHHFKLVLSMINGFKLWGRCAMNFIKLGWDHLFIK